MPSDQSKKDAFRKATSATNPWDKLTMSTLLLVQCTQTHAIITVLCIAFNQDQLPCIEQQLACCYPGLSRCNHPARLTDSLLGSVDRSNSNQQGETKKHWQCVCCLMLRKHVHIVRTHTLERTSWKMKNLDFRQIFDLTICFDSLGWFQFKTMETNV